jgi:hypothetical protein
VTASAKGPAVFRHDTTTALQWLAAVVGAYLIAGLVFGLVEGDPWLGVRVVAIFLAITAVPLALVLLGPFSDYLVEEHPSVVLFSFSILAVIGGGTGLSSLASSMGTEIRQTPDVFAVLAQLIVTFVVAFMIEVGSIRLVSANTVDSNDETSPGAEVAALVSGMGLAAAVGFVAALYGTIHPHPGLAFVFMPIATTLLFLAMIVALPAVRIARLDRRDERPATVAG